MGWSGGQALTALLLGVGGGLGWPGSPSFLSAFWGRAGDRWGGGGTGSERAGTTSVFSSQGLLLLQLSGHRLPAAATARQGQQDPHCGLGRSQLLAPAGPRALSLATRDVVLCPT